MSWPSSTTKSHTRCFSSPDSSYGGAGLESGWTDYLASSADHESLATSTAYLSTASSMSDGNTSLRSRSLHAGSSSHTWYPPSSSSFSRGTSRDAEVYFSSPLSELDVGYEHTSEFDWSTIVDMRLAREAREHLIAEHAAAEAHPYRPKVRTSQNDKNGTLDVSSDPVSQASSVCSSLSLHKRRRSDRHEDTTGSERRMRFSRHSLHYEGDVKERPQPLALHGSCPRNSRYISCPKDQRKYSMAAQSKGVRNGQHCGHDDHCVQSMLISRLHGKEICACENDGLRVPVFRRCS
ncbi:hypothetical protein KP509_13G054900 [Ceratopteris richardii]|uniref:Uncharacterized protein n=1 Tax=Ceratopteris richardii TaxID=49495 RepID=A0A8T2TFL8_CERRI|nr:hypothetical protein KP509_13G054900 [Ceratopteris richardii]